ncbi:MAG: alpha-L-rhamnosidase C-terminal domain-containing protein [Siphonobacter sp.]
MNRILWIALLLTCLASRMVKADFLPEARWISTQASQSATNTWLAYRKTIDLSQIPEQKVIASIAVDSKYWLWINERLVVFEGGLKRGPSPLNSYYDEVDLTPYLTKGKNRIALLLWYFGKDGFSHKSSGRAGMLWSCPALHLVSDKNWKCVLLNAYQMAEAPHPNFRLSESSICYDARKAFDWQSANFDENRLPAAMELGKAGDYPWNNLVKRPIPLWKNGGLQSYSKAPALPAVNTGDTLVCELPYNLHLTPYLKVEAPEGEKISVFTDNYLTFNGGEPNIRAEYITRKGEQSYENLAWVNGHKVYYVIPKGIKILDLSYRETGYNAEFTGSFASSDSFFNSVWEKSRRTLYVTMRDTYMDCPDRERAQWTGDAVNESGEAFYALSPSSHLLAKKWLHELVSWQRPDGSLYSPIPSATWDKELPEQVLATIGQYGLWNYYLHTGDWQTLQDVYQPMKRYLDLWKPDEQGGITFRAGDWTWGDWGDNRDIQLLYKLWYYLAVKGMANVATELGERADVASYKAWMEAFKPAFQHQFWTGKAYRHPSYQGKTDDRVQALAVLAGVANPEQYPQLLSVFQTEEHASPYMEKYVFEAMFQMNYVDEALKRYKSRFSKMVNNPYFTTLFEGWGIGKEGFGGGTVNHAWSGGGLTILSQYLCGIVPLEPAYQKIKICPQPGAIQQASATVHSVAGMIRSAFKNEKHYFELTVEIPTGSKALLGIPDKELTRITVNGKLVWKKGRWQTTDFKHPSDTMPYCIPFEVGSGVWKVMAYR